MEPESSLPYSQAHATRPYPEPTQSSPHNPFPLNVLQTYDFNLNTKRTTQYDQENRHIFRFCCDNSNGYFIRKYHGSKNLQIR